MAGAVAVGSSSVASTSRGVVARLRERLQRVLQRRRADDGRRGVQERPRPVRARAAGQPGRQRAGLGGRDDGRRRRRGRAAGHRQRGRHDRRMPRRRPASDVERVRRTVSRSLPSPSTSPQLRRSLQGLQRARTPGIRADGQKARVDHLVKCSRRASKAAWTVADPAVSSAPWRSSRRAPSPSASSSERCARSSCWASCAAGATTLEWSFDHRPGGPRGAGSAVVPGWLERSLAASRRGRRGCVPGSSRGVQGGARRPEPGVPQAGSAGRQTVGYGPSDGQPVEGSSRGPSEDPRRRVTAGRRRNLLGRALRNVPGFPTPVRGSSRRASEGLPGTVVGGVCRGRLGGAAGAHATSAEDLREGLAGLHRRVVAEPRRCVPRPLRRGRLPRLPMHPKSGPSGRRRGSLRGLSRDLPPVWPGPSDRDVTGFECHGPSRTHAAAAREPAGGAGGVAFDGHLTIVSGVPIGPTGRHERLPTERQRARSSGGSRSPRATVRGLVGASRGCRARTEPPTRAPLASQICVVTPPGTGTVRRAPSGETVAQAAIKDR